MILWLALILISAYFFYTRIWLVFSKVHYYKKQGVPFHDGIYPIFGSYLGVMNHMVKEGEKPKGHPINEFLEENYFKGKKETAPIVGLVFGTTVGLVVNSPELSQELYLSKNKYFDKHPKTAEIFSRLTGDSILFAKSDILWQKKRKALSAALYKDKLRIMMEVMKGVTIDMIRNKWMKAEDLMINIVSETSNLFINITIGCLFGSGFEDLKVPQIKSGVQKEYL